MDNEKELLTSPDKKLKIVDTGMTYRGKRLFIEGDKDDAEMFAESFKRDYPYVAIKQPIRR